MKIQDHFYDYLDYCENEVPVTPGDYLQMRSNGNRYYKSSTLMKLVEDLRDTYEAGLLEKVPVHSDRKGAAYVRR